MYGAVCRLESLNVEHSNGVTDRDVDSVVATVRLASISALFVTNRLLFTLALRLRASVAPAPTVRRLLIRRIWSRDRYEVRSLSRPVPRLGIVP